MTEQEQSVLAKYSTPGLRKGELTRAVKRDHLAAAYKIKGAAAKLILDAMYGEEAAPVRTAPPCLPVIREVIREVTVFEHQPPRSSFAHNYEDEVVLKTREPLGFLSGRRVVSSSLSGNICEGCGGGYMVRTGSCETCQDCGWNKGCG